MAVKMSMTCTRCHREDTVEVPLLADAQRFEALHLRRADVLKKLNDFVAEIPVEERPDFFAIIGEETLSHAYLCEPEDTEKRSCAQRVLDLMKDAHALPERKPRTKKEKTALVIADSDAA